MMCNVISGFFHYNLFLIYRLMNLCAILNGIAGTVPFAGPALVANTWFPPQQRTTATAVSSVFNYGGVAMAFVIGVWCHQNHTYIYHII